MQRMPWFVTAVLVLPNMVLLLLQFLLPACSAFCFHDPCAPAPPLTAFLQHNRRPCSSSRVRLQDTINNHNSDADWKDFRAKLVLNNNMVIQNRTPSSSTTTTRSTSTTSSRLSSSWAYDAGTFIEIGSIVLSKVEDDKQHSELLSSSCDLLRQPYLHKSAILVLDHQDNNNQGGFTRGIILNRQTNLTLHDKDIEYRDMDGVLIEDEFDSSNNPHLENATWRNMLFGGDIGGLSTRHHDHPQYHHDYTPDDDDDDDDDESTSMNDHSLIFLHSIGTDLARNISDSILKNIWITTHEGARMLIAAGEAISDDFYVVCGMIGWDSGQLLEELHRPPPSSSWYMVATDSETIWDLLRHQREENNPRNAGLTMWQNLTQQIGKYDDVYSKKMDEKHDYGKDSFSDLMLKEWTADMLLLEEDYFDDAMIYRALGAAQGPPIGEGTLCRGSSLEYSPFLLNKQLFHKSIMLVFQDDDDLSVGLILNHPTPDQYELVTPQGRRVEFTIRYGGWDGRDDVDPFIWLHSSQTMRDAEMGTPLGNRHGIWSCSQDSVSRAIDKGLALAEDFMLVQGFSVWEKKSGAGGVAGQVLAGNFETVSASHCEIWSILQSQTRLTETTLDENIRLSNHAWEISGMDMVVKNIDPGNDVKRMVFDSFVSVSDLADQALRNWIITFVLNGVSYEPP